MDDYRSVYERVRLDAYQTMVDGGYLARIERYGPELARWRDYLELLRVPGPVKVADPLARPTIFPMVPGLHSTPWREENSIPESRVLRDSLPLIRRELESVDASSFLHYGSVVVTTGHWQILPLFALGEEAGTFLYPNNGFQETVRIIRSLAGACPTFPLADVLFSAHAPRTTLESHCSWDPFRLRLSMGIRVSGNCRIRVGTQWRAWREGEVLAFHDCFEHETYNDSDEPRVVLIVDLWHPDLTESERRAILACFRKREIRTSLMKTRAPAGAYLAFEKKFTEAEQTDPLVAEFWDR